MTDELREKLVYDLEARKRLDQLETGAWYSGFKAALQRERDINAFRLGVEINDIGVAIDFNNKLKELEKAREDRIKSSEARHTQIDADIIAERTDHVWIDARREAVYFDAKKVWQLEVDSAAQYKRFPSNDVYDRFVNSYGLDVAQQLIKDTVREFEQKQIQEAKLQQEKDERVKAFQAEEEQRLATEAAQKLAHQQKLEQQQTAYRLERKGEQFGIQNDQVTTDRRKPFNADIELLKAQRKIDRAEIERLKKKLINPVDVSTPRLEQLQRDEQQKQLERDEQQSRDTYNRIKKNIEQARERAQRNPVDETGSRYERMMKKIKDRSPDQDW